MNAKKRFPSLAELDNEDIRRLLKRSTLSREDRHIAACCLCWDMDDVDTAAASGCAATCRAHRAITCAASLLRLLLRMKLVRSHEDD